MGIDYVMVLLFNATNAVMSYNTFAGSLAQDPAKSVSKQALHKAMARKSFVHFFEQFFSDVLLSKLSLEHADLRKKFHRIIIQDSTIIKLPERLFNQFSGVKNGFVQVANARIQFALNLLSNNLVHFSLDSYSTNDLVAETFQLRQNDLIIKDRGYFSTKDIIRTLNAKAHFIYRYKHGIYHDAVTGEELDLLNILNKYEVTDMMVKISGIDGPMVRLIAMPVSIELANDRRAKLKKTAKNTPKQKVLALLSWSIFITSIDDENIDYKAIFKMYRLRWRIEILFKAMKSHINLDQIHNVSKVQLEFMILAKLLLTMVILQFVYEPLCKPIMQFYNKNLSILKITKYLLDNKNILNKVVEVANAKKIENSICLYTIAKYCSYEKRVKRANYTEDFLMSLP
jgi:hypothetical protein